MFLLKKNSAKSMKNSFFQSFKFIILLFISSCAPKYTRPIADIDNIWPKSSIEESNSKLDKNASLVSWKKFFKNKEIQDVILIALKNNRDYKIAALNSENALQYYRIKRSELLPTINSNFLQNKQKTPPNSVFNFSGNVTRREDAFIINNYRANLLSTSFEIDLFGKISNLSKRSREEFFSLEENKNSVKISLISQVVQSYLQICANIEHMKIIDEEIKIEEKNFELTNALYENGSISKIDLLSNKKNLQNAKAYKLKITRIFEKDKNIFLNITGLRNDSDIIFLKLDEIIIDENLNNFLPSEIILSRPDVKAAEHIIKSYNANIGAARAAFLPSISVTSNYGFASTQISNLFSSKSKDSWNFTPQISIPIFSAGAAIANLKSAKIQKELAIENYQKIIRNAFFEIAEELLSKKNLKEELDIYKAISSADLELYELFKARFDNGSDNFFQFIERRKNLLNAKIQENEVKRQYLNSTVNLYKAMGGGVDD